MKYYSHSSLISAHFLTFLKTKKPVAVIVFFLFLLSSRIWADDMKEYIYIDGRAVAVETDTVTPGGGGIVCTYSISPTSASPTASGGPGSVSVTSSHSSCAWTASSNALWITVTGGSGGTGNGTVSYTVAANASLARAGTITIAGNTFTITQGGISCQQTCTDQYQTCGSQADMCPGQCEADAFVYCNGAIWHPDCQVWYSSCVSDCTSSIQSACYSQYDQCQTSCYTTCGYVLSSTSVSISSGGTSGTVNISSNSCDWTASSNAQWLQVTSGASGTGKGTIGYSASANTGPQRTGKLTIAQEIFTVTQADGCSYTLSANSASPTASGGSNNVTVTGSDAGCTPAATSNDAWITNVSVSGSGINRTASYTVSANPGPARTGTITIGGKTFTINQANGCTYNISPGSASPAAGGSSGSVSVTSSSGCPWTATSNAAWITVTSGSSGTGNGTVGYTVSSNPGPTRTGTITIGGKTFNISQANGCSYGLTAYSASHGSGSSSGSVGVTTSSGSCSWSASGNSWVSITGGSSGTGAGTVYYSVAANIGPARSIYITIAGNSFNVSQASGCTYSISPTSVSIAPAGVTSNSVTVTRSNPSCPAPTASSNATPWLIASVNVSGNVNYTAYMNSGAERKGTITISGQTFAVTQRSGAACWSQYQTCNNDAQSQAAMCASQCEADAWVYCGGAIWHPACHEWYYSCISECESAVYFWCDYQYSTCMSY